MKKLLLLLSLICCNLDSFSQRISTNDGPSLASTLDWVSTNVVNVYVNDSLNYKQKLTYDLENECQCRLTVSSMHPDSFLHKVYTFNFGDIAPETIQMEQKESLVHIRLTTYRQHPVIKVTQDNMEESSPEVVIYDKSPENATRLIRAFVHIANLCKR